MIIDMDKKERRTSKRIPVTPETLDRIKAFCDGSGMIYEDAVVFLLTLMGWVTGSDEWESGYKIKGHIRQLELHRESVKDKVGWPSGEVTMEDVSLVVINEYQETIRKLVIAQEEQDSS